MFLDAKNEREWLKYRKNYLTASDASNYCGVNSYDKNGKMNLWLEKTGRQDRPYIGNKPAVIFGKDTEPTLRSLFLNLHPEYICKYHQFGLYISNEYPWMASTLDGLLIDQFKHKRVLEIKTGTARTPEDLKKWTEEGLPINYYCQIIHQLITIPDAVGVHVFALIILSWDPTQRLVFERYFDRNDAEFQKDMDWVLNNSKDMYNCIIKDKEPV